MHFKCYGNKSEGCKTTEIWVDDGCEVYNRSVK